MDSARFARAWRALGAVHADAFLELERCYAEPHRAYHGAEHIEECLTWLDRVAQSAGDEAELAIAIYFHDADYEPGAPDNESSSAALMGRLASSAHVETGSIARCRALIESTRDHDQSQGDAALLADIDLSILGASQARYARYERDIRIEYGAYPDAPYVRGGAKVLASFLARETIYRTEEIGGVLEAAARENLERALASLEPRR